MKLFRTGNHTAVWLVGAGAAAAAFGVYCRTLAPGLSFIDSGELGAVCATAGIAHPTGYPLYTLLGWLLTRTGAARPILLLNLMSAACAAAAVLTTYLLACEVYLTGPQRPRPGPAAAAALGSGALLLAFSRVFWSTALSAEVYALQALLTALIALLSMRAFCARTPGGSGPTAALFFVTGLAFCNHMGTVLVLPAAAVCAAACRDRWKPDAKKLLAAGAAFAAGLLPYAYLPLRAAQKPALNWGNPASWETLWWHLSGKQYRVWMFSSLEAALKQAEYFLQLLTASFGFVPLLLVPFGLWHLFRCSRAAGWFSVLYFLTTVAYAVNYDIRDIEPYFLPAFAMCGLWMSGGLILFVSVRPAAGGLPGRAAAACLGLLFLLPLALNYRAVDRSGDRMAERYTRNILRSLDAGALVLSYQWDYFCSPFLYLQHAEAVRTDVDMVEVKLLKRSWYLDQLRRTAPELMDRSREEVFRFSRELDKFEHARPYDPAAIQGRYMEMINSFIFKSLADRPVALTCEQERDIGTGLQRIPEGFVFRLVPPGSPYRPFDYSQMDLPRPEDFSANDPYHTALKSFYAFMLAARGIYELEHGRRADARQRLSESLAIAPGYPLALKGMAKLKNSNEN